MSDIVRPEWDDYFMALAFVISQKSLDPSTKHGCVVVDDDMVILSVGYNSPPRGCIDEEIPLTRPEKYPYFVHSEENAIISAARSGVSLKGSTFYITGFPCSRCFRGIRNVGAKKIVYGPISSACVPEEEKEIIRRMNRTKKKNVHNVKMVEYGCKETGKAANILDLTLHYIRGKMQS